MSGKVPEILELVARPGQESRDGSSDARAGFSPDFVVPPPYRDWEEGHSKENTSDMYNMLWNMLPL